MTEKSAEKRSPIVVVMGHVDHGKTSLLDYIRKANVVAREAGGITQSIGAYEITHAEKRMTFVDTPGHEAFSKMRSRGARVADLAILVVAADDGVKPQTREAIRALREAKTTFVVAINKMDKNNADPERVKKELLQEEVLLEGYGGNVSYQQISAKTGEGVSELLDLLLLAADFEDLSYSQTAPARGVVIEAKLDRRRGNEVMVVMKDGVLRRGDEISTPTASGKAKTIENFLGQQVSEARPSSPALLLGFEHLPIVGEEFILGARKVELPESKKQTTMSDVGSGRSKEGGLILNCILKADVSGSLEAVRDIISALPQNEVKLRIFEARVGDIGDGDVKSAIATGSTIFGFHVRVDKGARVLAEANKIKIITADIIYELVRAVEEEINNLKSPKPEGILEVLAVFNQTKTKQLIGGKVLEGTIKVKKAYDIKRGEEIVGAGRIVSLKQNKKEATIVEAGKECGMFFDSGTQIAVGDILLLRHGE